MAKKTDTKKTKPTQQQLIHEDIVAQIETNRKYLLRIKKEVKSLTNRVEQVGVLANNVAEISDRVADCRREVSKLLPPSPPAVVEEQPKFKVGEWVVCLESDHWEPARGCIAKVRDDSAQRSVYTAVTLPDGSRHSAEHKHFRPATESEVLAYKEGLERSKWDGKERLQFGDYCSVNAEQQRALVNIYKALYPLSQTWLDTTHLQWCDHTGVPLQHFIMRPRTGTETPYEVFLRCLENEVKARKEEERKAEEAKPLEFGTPVKYGKAAKAIWMGVNGLIHEIAFPNSNGTWKTSLCDRSEFTIKS